MKRIKSRLSMTNLRLLILPLLIATVAAQSSETPTFEQVLSLRQAFSGRLSPDGTQVVFTTRTANWKENRFEDQLWLARPGEAPFQLTRSEKGSSAASWSPDGKWVAFLSDRGDKRQVFLIRASGGEAQQVTSVKEGVTQFEWSPDGNRIAFTTPAPESPEQKEREERYGKFSVEDEETRNQQLWVTEVRPDPWPSLEERSCSGLPDGCETAKSEQLTRAEDFSVASFSWSPDGSRIAIEHHDHADILSFFSAEISILRPATGDLQPLIRQPSFDGNPVWSPDSKWILYQSASGDDSSNFYRNGHLLRIAADGGPSERLGMDIDEQISSPQWTPQGIFALVRDKTNRHLVRIDPDGGITRKISPDDFQVNGASFSEDGSVVAVQTRDAETLPEIALTRLEPFQPTRLTRMSDQIADWSVGTSEVIQWTSTDGTTIEGVLHKPENFEVNRRYPLLVVIHGGPTGIDYPTPVPSSAYPVLQWLGRGAVVLRPNYRGSAGYGEDFRSLNVRNLGVGDAWDVLSGVDFLVEQGIADPEKIGAMGWSQGGYISAFLTTHSDRFKAISVGAGISNWVTYYVNTDIHPFTRQYLKATPWEDPEIYAVTSPMTRIRDATTPTLIQHGEFDRRVPIPNAYELYQGLQDVGAPTRLIVYKGFGHGINKPKERLAVVQHNWEWFEEHLWETASSP